MMALHIWSMSHGIASLFGRGDAARRALPMSPEELLEAGVLLYLRGPRRCRTAAPKTSRRRRRFRHPLTAGAVAALAM